MRGATRAADAGRARLLEAEDPLNLAELGVGILELRGPLDDHVDPDLVTDRHLVDEAAEVPLELGDAGGELIARGA